MADQEVALKTYTPDFSTFNPATPLQSATAFETGQTQLERLKRVNQGEDIQARNQLIRDAAAHAQDPESWDAAMRSAAAKSWPSKDLVRAAGTTANRRTA